MRKLIAVLFLGFVWVPSSLAQDDTAVVKKAISECLSFVHSLGVPFSKKFDAYYSVATRKVENNVAFVEERPALFQFQKCMAEHGLPLT
jgi:hypothetical protein